MGKQEECGRQNSNLSHVFYLDSSPLLGEWRVILVNPAQKLIQLRCLDFLTTGGIDFLGSVEDSDHSSPRQSRYEKQGGVADKMEFTRNSLFKFINRTGILLDQIPFIHNDEQRQTRFLREMSDGRVLTGGQFLSVQDETDDICSSDVLFGFDDTCFFSFVPGPT